MKTKLSRKKEIERLIDTYFSYKVKVEELSMKRKGNIYKKHDFTYWHNCHSFQEAKLEQLKEDAKEEWFFLHKLQKVLVRDHNYYPMIGVRILQLEEVLK